MRRTQILALCCVAQFIGLLDVTIVNVALPSMGTDLAFPAARLHWVVNAYTLALAGFLLLGGRAADLAGRREAFTGGLALCGLASLVGGLAQDEAMLVAARAGQGVGAALVAPAGLSILTTSFAAGRERNRAFAWWGTLGGLGGATGAVVGGLLTAALSWRWVLLVNTPICLGAALAALHAIPPVRPRLPARSIDFGGALSVSAGLMLVTLAIVNAARQSPTAAATLGPAAAGAAALGLFLVIESRLAAAPLVPLGIFRSRALSGAAAVALCLGAVTFSMWFLASLYLQRLLGLSALQGGLAFVPVSLTIIVSTRLGSRLATRIGPGPVMAAGMAVLAGGMLLFARVDVDGSWAGDVLVPSLLCAAGIGCSFVPATIVATSAVAVEDAGLAAGLLNTAYQVGSSLGLALLASVALGPTAGSTPEPAALAEGLRSGFAGGGVVGLVGSGVAIAMLVRATDRRMPRSP